MATDVERLAVLIEANTKSYERAMEKVEQRTKQVLSRVEKQYADSGSRVDALLSKLGAGLFAGGLAAAAYKAATSFKALVSGLSDIADMAERAGVSTDFLQAVGFRVEQAGGSMEDAARAAAKFGKELGDVNVEQSYLGRLLAANNINIKSFGKDGQAVFEAYARVVANAEDPQTALNMVSNMFGDKVGPKMLSTIREIGEGGLPQFIDKLKEAGLVLDENLVKKGDEIADKFDEIWKKVVRGAQFAVVQLAEALQGMYTEIKQDFFPDPATFQQRFHFNGPKITVNKPPPSKNVSATAPGRVRLDEFDRDLKNLRERVALMGKEAEVMDLGTYARERAMIVTKLETAAKEANVAAGKKNTEVTAEQRTKIEEMADAYAAAAVQLEAAKGPLREFAREGANVNNQFQEAVVSGLKGFEDALIGIVQGTKNAKEAFRDMANAIISDLIRIAIRQNITGPIAGLLGGGSGGGIFGGLFGGFRAGGGDVMPGKAYVVGEKRPELFVPDVAGKILPSANAVGGSVALTVRVSLDNEMLRAVVVDQSNRVVARAAPSIINTATQNAVKTVPAVRRNNPGYLR